MDREPRDTPKLIITDLDGTLLGSDREVSDRSAAVLERATAAGARVVIATGRPLRFVRHLRDRVHSSIALCANGALVVDLETGDVLHSHLLDGERVIALSEELRAGGAEFAIAAEGLTEVGMFAEEHYPFPHLTDRQRMPLAEFAAQPMIKLLVRPAEGHHDEVLRVLAERYADVLLATSSGVAGLIEVSLAGISKGTVIDGLAQGVGDHAGAGHRLRRPAQRPRDAALGRPWRRDGQRRPRGAGRGRRGHRHERPRWRGKGTRTLVLS